MRGERDVRQSPDAGVEHAAHPRVDAEVLAAVEQCGGAEPAAEPGGLDAHHGAGSDLDGPFGDLDARERLVEADRRGDAAGERCVLVERVGGQRLLDAPEVELVEFGEMGGVVERVRAVGISHQDDVGSGGIAGGAHHLEIVSGGDLELDAPVALGDAGAHLGGQCVR